MYSGVCVLYHVYCEPLLEGQDDFSNTLSGAYTGLANRHGQEGEVGGTGVFAVAMAAVRLKHMGEQHKIKQRGTEHPRKLRM